MSSIPQSRWPRLHARAAAQHGLVARWQALELGFAASTMTAMVHRGEWRRVEPGVYAVSGDRPTTRERTAAALLRCPGAAATGWTAAWLWDLVDAATTTIDLVVPAGGPRGPTTTRTRVRRSSTLTTSDVVVRDGLRVVTTARMLVDLAGSVDMGALRRLAIDARQRRLLELSDLGRGVEQAGRVGGVGRLRRLVDELGAGRVDSVLEHRVRRLLEAAGLRPHPEPWPVTVGGETIFLDIAFPEQRVAVEPDGWAFHSTRAQLARDHRRSNLLQHTDWKVLRIGWHDVDERPREVVAELRALLRSQGWHPDCPGQPVRSSR